MKTEIEKLLAEIEKRFGVNWGFNHSGRQPGSHFIQTGKGILINPGKWQAFKKECLKNIPDKLKGGNHGL